MQRRPQFGSAPTGEPAASPVIGVILMIAITVILGGLIGTFVLGLGDPLSDRPPTAQFSVEYSDSGDGYLNHNDWVNVTHESGDAIDPDRVRVVVGGTDVNGVASNWSDRVRAGDTLTITDSATDEYATTGDIRAEDRVRLIWRSPRSNRTVVLFEAEGPPTS